MITLSDHKALMLLHGDINHDQRVRRAIKALEESGLHLSLYCALTTSASAPEPGSFPTLQSHKIRAQSGPLHFSEAITRAASFVRSQNNFDLIHAHDLDMALAAVWGRPDPTIPVIYDSHEWWTESTGVGSRPWIQAIWRLWERWLVHQPNVHIITVTPGIGERFKQQYHLSESPVIVRNAANPQSVPASQTILPGSYERILKQWRSDGHSIMVYAGAFHPGRSLEHALHCVAQNDRLRLLLIGDGQLRDRLKKLVKQLNIGDQVVFTGMLSYERMMTLLPYCDIGWCLIEPISESYRLALPNKLFDYLAADLEVLATRLPEMVRQVPDHPNVHWIESPLDIHSELAQRQLLKVDKSSKGAFNQVDYPLNWNRDKKRLTEFYQRILSQSS